MSAPPQDPPDAPCNDLPRSAPECSVLLCGLSTSLLTLTSSLKWSTNPASAPKDPGVTTADFKMKEGSITLFRDASQEPQHVTQTRLIFVHDASNSDVEASVACLRRYRELQLQYCNKSLFWVVISRPESFDNAPGSNDGLVARFERELRATVDNDASREFGTIGCRVIETQVENACREIGEAMHPMPEVAPTSARQPDRSPGQLTIEEFMHCFLYGSITPWNHNEYLRAAYITLLEPEDKEVPLLEMATRFAAKVDRFKQRNRLGNQPESRTLTVFWLYHIRLAMSVMRAYHTVYSEYCNFKQLLHYIPEIVNDDLPTTYYSPDILKSECSEKFWMLPNLRELIEPMEHPDLSFRGRFTKKQPEDPERLLRFAFAVVQRYLRPDETRRRSWFINLAFASLQQYTTRLRSTQPQVSPYSETQSYFYLQLVHAALSGLILIGGPELVQELSYPQFKATFSIVPSAWTAHYSAPLWNSLKARASFVPPDRKPLPDTIHAPKFWIGPTNHNAKARFHKLGLIPELPSPEILHFHQALLLEDAKPLPATLFPSTITTHAHLLKYIHTHLILPPPSPESTIPHHAKLLTTHSPLPNNHITFYLHLLLHTPDLQPPYTPSTPTRYHNCPCHATIPIRWPFSPNAVTYPDDAVQRLGLRREQERGWLRHGCMCHGGEKVVGELGAVEKLVEGGVVEGVEGVKGMEGLKGVEGLKGAEGVKGVGEEVVGGEGGDVDVNGGWQRGVEWEDWVRGKGGLVFCWDGAWKEGGGGEVPAVGGGESEGREGGDLDAADEKTLRGEECDSEGKEGKGGGGEETEHADADEKTLAGKEGEEEDDWEVLSQDTPC